MAGKKNSKAQQSRRKGAALVAVAALVLLAGLLLLTGRLRPQPAAEPEDTEPTIPMPEANPYFPGDFEMGENGYLTCTVTGGALPGVDVSEHQGAIDWQQAADSGIRFAMIRVGYRGYGSGALVEDSYALENLRGAKAAGLKIGAYFYSQAVTPEEAQEEAELAAKLLKGIKLDLPLVFDWEYVSADARTGAMTRSTLTACAERFCESAEQSGFEPMIYFNLDMSRTLFDLSALRDRPFWLAQYTGGLDFPYRVSMWQYTSSGSVPGIEGDVDIDLLLP